MFYICKGKFIIPFKKLFFKLNNSNYISAKAMVFGYCLSLLQSKNVVVDQLQNCSLFYIIQWFSCVALDYYS